MSQSTPYQELNITIWNANGCARHAISAITDSLSSSSLLFMSETWLLPPLRYPTHWQQYHTYGLPVEDSYRGKMGITLLVNPECPYPVTHFPSSSPYVLSCQVASLLIHCVYLPPSTLSDTEALDILRSLATQTHPSQSNTIICGDINARHQLLLGDTRTTTRGTLLQEWLEDTGLTCWNSRLAFGVPTYSSQSRVHHQSGVQFKSVIDLFISTQELVDPTLVVREDLNMGSDHHPVSLTCLLPELPPPPPTHPRKLWNLSRLTEEDCTYVSIFSDRILSFHERLLTFFDPHSQSYLQKPDHDALAAELTGIIHSSLDDSVGRKNPKQSNNSWFWTPLLQDAFDHREHCRKEWHRAVGIEKCQAWDRYQLACHYFNRDMKRRRRETWRQFCNKLSSGPLQETASIVRRVKRNRAITPTFNHPNGPQAAADTMANHLKQVFSGASLPASRYPAPPIPSGPHAIDLITCPFTESTVRDTLVKRLSRRKAPGVDDLRTEMLLPIAPKLVPVLTLLFCLCWKWSTVPAAWCTAQVVPIYKKGNPLEPGNFRPISLTSVLRKLLELCIFDELESSAPPLDTVQGGFRRSRSTLDQALCLHELCRQHAEDHYGEAPVLAFLDIKSAYDTVDRAIIWRALETYISEPLLGLLQSLFDKVSIQVLINGHSSRSFWPKTGVLQGSILSPFLYSIYINSLPAVLRAVPLPISSRVFGTMPRREYSGLWINCLLYADDVVIIAAPDVMPRLLRRAAQHSMELGYRWNPAKCVVVNSPTIYGAPPLRLRYCY
ncbi:hypothetical protein G6F61_011080 [Rhizopus arrhizus]|nr:hypothetical protein G6F42_015469 [Rhizopus arrhizus]KAG1372412.1 hypothetical protein G6F61_011080 [Rhizopus arrhizus]